MDREKSHIHHRSGEYECIESMKILLNSYDEHIQFTEERERDEGIVFLDMTLKREKGKIITNWYLVQQGNGNESNFGLLVSQNTHTT